VSDETTPLDPAAFLRDHVAPRARRRIEELRAQAQRLERDIADRVAAEATIALVLEGDGDGGTWYLVLHAGDMQLTDTPPAPPLLRIRQSRADWEVLARAQLAGAGGPPGGADLTATRIARLRGLDGALTFRLTTDDGMHTVTLDLGPEAHATARCTVTVRADDARRMQTGELAPQAAFLQGLVKIEGDLAFAMQLGAALLM
jgi:hypothetical protein